MGPKRRRRGRRNPHLTAWIEEKEMELDNRQGPMFAGNKVAATARDNTLQTVMNDIDSHEVNGLLPHGTIQRVVDANRVVYPWLTRYQIDGLRKRRLTHRRELAIEEAAAERQQFMDDNSIDSFDSFDSDHIADEALLYTAVVSDPLFVGSTVGRKKGSVGRKKGSTDKAKAQYLKRKNLLIDEISDTWYDLMKDDDDNTALFELIACKKYEHNLIDVHIPETTIYSRVRRGNTNNVQRGLVSPMAAVEPTLCHLLKYASRMGQYISQQNTINMANELIEGTPIADNLREWKEKFNAPSRDNKHSGIRADKKVGWGWFAGFVNRYKEVTSKYISNVKHYRKSWSTWAMMLDMYSMIYALFVLWGHAVELEHPQWQDQEGNEVPEDQALGSIVKYKLTHPDLILTMDETGDKGDQSEDNPTRNNKVMCETTGPPPTKGAATDNTSWTVQGFTTLGGKAILAVVIIKKGSECNFNEEYGYDFEADWVGEGEQPCLLGELRPAEDDDDDDDDNDDHDELPLSGRLPTQEQMNANMGRHRRYPGPISCLYNGITIPGLVFSSKGGGVTPQILVESLKHLDRLGVYPRGNGLPDPALLVDGHGSRLAPVFVAYVNNLQPDLTPDPMADHRWNVALGLPYATGIWQVGDSPQENGAFKHYSRVKKTQIREYYAEQKETPHIRTYDILPIVNFAFRRYVQQLFISHHWCSPSQLIAF